MDFALLVYPLALIAIVEAEALHVALAQARHEVGTRESERGVFLHKLHCHVLNTVILLVVALV